MSSQNDPGKKDSNDETRPGDETQAALDFFDKIEDSVKDNKSASCVTKDSGPEIINVEDSVEKDAQKDREETDTEKPFSCTNCEMSFRTKHELENHVLTHQVHTPTKFRYCSHCSLKCPESAWKEHELTHTTKAFSCSQCNKNFVKSEDFKDHEQIACMPFRCSKCNQSFKERKSFQHIDNE